MREKGNHTNSDSNDENLSDSQQLRRSNRTRNQPSKLAEYHVPIKASHTYSDADILNFSQSSSQGATKNQESNIFSH